MANEQLSGYRGSSASVAASKSKSKSQSKSIAIPIANWGRGDPEPPFAFFAPFCALARALFPSGGKPVYGYGGARVKIELSGCNRTRNGVLSKSAIVDRPDLDPEGERSQQADASRPAPAGRLPRVRVFIAAAVSGPGGGSLFPCLLRARSVTIRPWSIAPVSPGPF